MKTAKIFFISLLTIIFICCGAIVYCCLDKGHDTQDVKEKMMDIRAKAMEYNLDGVDVSHHNGSIDWKLVAKDKRIKFMYAKSSEGLRFRDSKYRENAREAKKAGIKVGAYHYYQEDVEPKAQFKNFKAAVGDSWGDLIPVVDFECVKGNVEILRKDLKAFCDLIEKDCGKKPIIYVGANYYNRILKGHFDDYYMWADWKWKPVRAGFKNLAITQYAINNREDFPNSKGGVDCNALNVPLEDIMLDD